MRERIAAAFVCMLLSAAGAVAQQSGTGAMATSPGTGAAAASPAHDAQAAAATRAGSPAPRPAAKASRRVPPGSELDTMRTCRVHGQRTMEYIDQATRSVQQARLTRDPARTRAALDQMQVSLSQMKQHMAICMERLAQSH